MPAFTTTTVRGLTAATRRTSSSWRPGSAQGAAVEALALGHLGRPDHHHGRVRRGRRPLRLGQQRRPRRRPARCRAGRPAGPRRRPPGRNSSRISASRPAVEPDRGPDLAGPGHGLDRVVGHRRRVVGDHGAVHGQGQPADSRPRRQVRPGESRPEQWPPRSRCRSGPSRCPAETVWSHQASAVDVRCSAPSRPPSASRNSSRRPRLARCPGRAASRAAAPGPSPRSGIRRPR